MSYKYSVPNFIIEVVPNLVWVRGDRAVISLYSLRHPNYANSYGCDFDRAITIVKQINQDWEIKHWCFDWSAERDLALSDEKAVNTSIFTVLTNLLIGPLREFLSEDYYTISFMHGDANFGKLYEKWKKTEKPSVGFNNIAHHNRFFHHYNRYYPSARPEIILRGRFTSFNRKHTYYRKKLLGYLKDNQLLDLGYVNFSFADVSTLLQPIADLYETNELDVENQLYRYYRATDFDIIIETATLPGENQQFLTEKTLRALALGQPFLTYNGTGSLQHLRDLGFKTYESCWDESYDNIQDNNKRFNAVCAQISNLVSNSAIFEQSAIKEINLHNQLHFQTMAKLNHRELWLTVDK